MLRQALPILVEPPEEEEGDGCPEDAPDGNEAVAVVATVVEVLHEIQKESGGETSNYYGKGAQKGIRRAELTVTLTRQHPHIHGNHHRIGQNGKRKVRCAQGQRYFESHLGCKIKEQPDETQGKNEDIRDLDPQQNPQRMKLVAKGSGGVSQQHIHPAYHAADHADLREIEANGFL